MLVVIIIKLVFNEELFLKWMLFVCEVLEMVMVFFFKRKVKFFCFSFVCSSCDVV